MWLYFRLFLLALRLIRRSRRDLVLENLVLRQQLLVHERPDRRPRLTVADRRFWSTVAQRWRAWRAHVLIVQPPTVVRWHRCASPKLHPGNEPRWKDHRTSNLPLMSLRDRTLRSVDVRVDRVPAQNRLSIGSRGAQSSVDRVLAPTTVPTAARPRGPRGSAEPHSVPPRRSCSPALSCALQRRARTKENPT